MKKREFGVSFAVEASPWPVTSPGWEWQTGVFLGGSPEDFAPLFLFFFNFKQPHAEPPGYFPGWGKI